jgi:hypothetical protein
MKSAYSYHSGVRYSWNSSTFPHIISPETDLIMDIKTISVPLLIRISDCSMNKGFFFDYGAVLSFNVQNNSHFYKVESSGRGIFINELLIDELNADATIGYSLGFGYYRYFGKKRAYIEARTIKSIPLDDGEFNISQHQLVAGFSL